MVLLVQLQRSGTPIYPRTVAEGVMVHHHGKVELLNTVLDAKIELIKSESLSVVKNGPEIVIEHANQIDSNDTPLLLLILHDKHGHIVKTQAAKPLIINVNEVEHKQITPGESASIDFGDDFEVSKANKILLHWNELK